LPASPGDAAAQSHQTGLLVCTYHLVATAAEDQESLVLNVFPRPRAGTTQIFSMLVINVLHPGVNRLLRCIWKSRPGKPAAARTAAARENASIPETF